MVNRMSPPAEGQEKDVLQVLDKQQGKVSAVKGIDNEGNLQTVEPTNPIAVSLCRWTGTAICSATSFPISSVGIRTRKDWLYSAARLWKRNRTQNLSRTTTVTTRRRATNGQKCCEFRNSTVTVASRTIVSTRLKSTGRT